jgi:hypothetical protein
MRRPETVVEVSIDLWERLASELTSIIGEGGFQSLYTRSAHLTCVTFPWMVLSHPWQRTRFSDLKISLEGRDITEASEASITLLTTFVDILALLIGELLTTNILRSAWGDDVQDVVVKDLDNE